MFKFISSCLPIRKEKKSVKQVISLELPYQCMQMTVVDVVTLGECVCQASNGELLDGMCIIIHS